MLSYWPRRIDRRWVLGVSAGPAVDYAILAASSHSWAERLRGRHWGTEATGCRRAFLPGGPREDGQRRKSPALRSDKEVACSAHAPDTLWTEREEEKRWPSVRLSSAEMLRFWMGRR